MGPQQRRDSLSAPAIPVPFTVSVSRLKQLHWHLLKYSERDAHRQSDDTDSSSVPSRRSAMREGFTAYVTFVLACFP
jgi:hypothetical protein